MSADFSFGCTPKVLEQLESAVRTGSPHALLLCLPAGCGAVDSCREVAAYYLENNKALVMRGAHPDCAEVYGEGASGDIKVQTLRGVLSECSKASALSDRRVVIIPSAELLGAAAAAALLKSLEEPPANTLFVLCAQSAQQLLDTVASRCAVFRLNPPTPEQALKTIRERVPEADAEKLRTVQSVFGFRTEYMLQALRETEKFREAQQAQQLCEACLAGDRLAVLTVLNVTREQLKTLLSCALMCSENLLVSGREGADRLARGLCELSAQLEKNMHIPTICANFCARVV